jgi:outer membrane protein assembly factor BamA
VLAFALFAMLFSAVSVAAQGANAQTCRGPIYTRKEVSKPAKLIDQPNFKTLYEAFGAGVGARVKLDAVLCRSGKVTDILIIDSQPPDFGKFVAAAVSMVRFKPAEMNWHTVSQREQFEFHFGDDWKLDAIDSTAAKGRLVEELDIIGYRRMTLDQIMGWIKTRAGDPYNPEQVHKDLLAINASGYFDSRSTRVRLEHAVRGGVRITFEVVELPLIRRLWFRGVSAADEFAIMGELVKPSVNIRIGAPPDPERLKAATAAIKQYLQSNGWGRVNVETVIEDLSLTEVNITFIVTGDLKPKL